MTGKRKSPYEKKIGERGEIEIWQVDGGFIRKNLDEEFNNFGQHYRFHFIPENEFWIEKESEHDETSFFIDHLLVEHRLMKAGMPYKRALTKADKAEKKERHRDAVSRGGKAPHGKGKGALRTVHERLWKKLASGIKVWIVNGKMVRTYYDIEFTEGGHHQVYGYVPEGEVWIDDAVTAAERRFILLHETHELRLMQMGMKYDKAHEECSRIESYYRHHPGELSARLKAEEAVSEKD